MTTYAGEFDATATDRSAVGFGVSNSLTYQMSQSFGLGIGHTLALHPRIPDPATRHNIQAFFMVQHSRKRVTPFLKIGISNTFGGDRFGIGPHVGFGLNIISSGTFSLFQETTFNLVFPGTAVDGLDLSGPFDALGTIGIGLRITDIAGFFGSRDVGLKDIFTSAESSGYVVRPGQRVSFSADSESNNIQYQWDFGDGNAKDGQEVNHNYSSPGIFEVSVLAQNAGVSERRTLFLNVLEEAPEIAQNQNQENLEYSAPVITGNGSLRADISSELDKYEAMQLIAIARPENERRARRLREQTKKDRMTEIVAERLERERRLSGRQAQRDQEKQTRIEEEKLELARIENELRLKEETENQERKRIADLAQQEENEAREAEKANQKAIADSERLEAEKLAKIELDKVEKDLIESERLAKIEDNRLATEKAEEDKIRQARIAKLEADMQKQLRALDDRELTEEEADQKAQELAEKQRLENERLAKIEADRLAIKKAEEDEIRQARIAKLEADRQKQLRVLEDRKLAEEEAEQRAQNLAEKQRLEDVRLESERLAKIEDDKKAQEITEKQRLEDERLENERLAKIESEKKAREIAEEQRLEDERLENERFAKIEADKKKENLDSVARQQREQYLKAKAEADRLEREKQRELDRIEQERSDQEEAERIKADRTEKERLDELARTLPTPDEGRYTWVVKTFDNIEEAQSFASNLGEMGFLLTIEPSDSMYRLYKLHTRDDSGQTVYGVAWGSFADRDAGLSGADNLPAEFERPWMIQVKR